MYEVITTELQDDSDCVRDIVSYGVSGLLKHHHHGRQQFCLQPTRVMEKVCGLIGKGVEKILHSNYKSNCNSI